MDSRKLNILKLLCLSICFYAHLLNGQISNELDVHYKYDLRLTSDRFDQYYTVENYGYLSPTVLGNINRKTCQEVGVLFSGFSFYFQPVLNFRFNNYSATEELLERYKDFEYKSYSVGLGCKINIMQYGHQPFTPYLLFNTNIVISKISNSESSYTVTIDGMNIGSSYNLTINSMSNSKVFLNPLFESSFGVESIIVDKLLLVTEINLLFINFPNFDIDSPLFIKEIYLSFGLRYKLFKNKRYIILR